MSATTFRVVFAGKTLPGFDQARAIENLATLLKRRPDEVEKVFNGKSMAIKKGLPEAEAERYCRLLEQAGLMVHVEVDVGAGVASASAANAHVATPSPAAPEPIVKPAMTLSLMEDDAYLEQAPVRLEMVCPACRCKQEKAPVCSACGIVIAKFVQR